MVSATVTFDVNVQEAREWFEEFGDGNDEALCDEEVARCYLICQIESNSNFDGVTVVQA